MCVNLPLGVSIPHTHPDNCSRRRATSHIKPQSLFCLQPPWKLSLHNTFFPRDSSAEINVVFSFIKDKAAHFQFLTFNSFFSRLKHRWSFHFYTAREHTLPPYKFYLEAVLPQFRIPLSLCVSYWFLYSTLRYRRPLALFSSVTSVFSS